MKVKEILTERYHNVFGVDDKQRLVDDVWNILQKSYEPIGGIKGRGFSSKEEMVREIPMWKVGTRNGQVRAAVLYKDKGGRKFVAGGTDGSKEGKDLFKDMVKNEFERSFFEVSGPMLKFIERNFPDLAKKYSIPVSKVSDLIDDEITPVDQYTYTRDIGGHREAKRMMGTPGHRISR